MDGKVQGIIPVSSNRPPSVPRCVRCHVRASGSFKNKAESAVYIDYGVPYLSPPVPYLIHDYFEYLLVHLNCTV